MPDAGWCRDRQPHAEHEWYKNNILRRECAGEEVAGTVRKQLDKAISDALPMVGGLIKLRLTQLKEALAAHDSRPSW